MWQRYKKKPKKKHIYTYNYCFFVRLYLYFCSRINNKRYMDTMKKVNYPDYKNKYDESIKTQLEKSPESIDVEMMRENLYGYTYTKEYAERTIPNELSMDYWEDYHMENDVLDFDQMEDPDFFLGDAMGQEYFDLSPQEKLLMKMIDSTGDGKTPETAFCVIDVHQEYEYIARSPRFLCLKLVRQSVANGIDCLEFKNLRGGIEKVYFDITRRFEMDMQGIATSDAEGT